MRKIFYYIFYFALLLLGVYLIPLQDNYIPLKYDYKLWPHGILFGIIFGVMGVLVMYSNFVHTGKVG